MVPTSFVTNLILAWIFDVLGNPGLGLGLLISILVYCGFIIPIAINQNLFLDRVNIKLFLIEYGVYLVSFLVSGFILSLWI